MMGGSEKVYFETAELLLEKGHEVIYFSTLEDNTLDNDQIDFFVDEPDYKTNSIIKKIKNSLRFVYSFEAKQKLERLIEKEKPDLAHLHIFYGNLTSSILPVLKKKNIPIVMSVHEYRMLCPTYLMLDQDNKLCELCADGNYVYCVQKKCNKGSLANSAVSAIECYVRDKVFSYENYIDRFIMVSKFIENKHLQFKPQIKKKTVHIYNFLNVSKYATSTKKEDGFLYIGRLSKEKGVDTLIKAFQNLPEIHLKIAGDGVFRDTLENYVLEHDLRNVEFLGFLNSKEIKKVQSEVSYLIVPSEWYENNPMVVIEALSMGKPIIGSDIGGIPELIQEGKNGFLFEPGNLQDLIKTIRNADKLDEKNYMTLSRNARSFAEQNFDREEHYNVLMDTYQEVINETK
jgi:glycosyltransferase involved in cell wall biosynthesis